MSNKRVKI